MLFKDIKQGNQIYIFDRVNTDIKVGNVQTVSFPHLSTQPNMGMVIDLDVIINNETFKYQMKDSSDVAYVGTTVISPNVESILNEVRATRQQSQDIVDSVDKHKVILEKCSTLLVEFDPQYKERKENEQRLSNIEQSILELKNMITNITKS